MTKPAPTKPVREGEKTTTSNSTNWEKVFALGDKLTKQMKKDGVELPIREGKTEKYSFITGKGYDEDDVEYPNYIESKPKRRGRPKKECGSKFSTYDLSTLEMEMEEVPHPQTRPCEIKRMKHELVTLPGDPLAIKQIIENLNSLTDKINEIIDHLNDRQPDTQKEESRGITASRLTCPHGVMLGLGAGRLNPKGNWCYECYPEDTQTKTAWTKGGTK